jgi:hypothetical protein
MATSAVYSVRLPKATRLALENAAELQVVAHNLGEQLRMRLRGVTAVGKIGDSHARLVHAETSAGVEPVLGGDRVAGEKKHQDRHEREMNSL